MKGVWKKFVAESARKFAFIMGFLTFLSVLMSAFVDGNKVLDFVFPPAPLEGAWSGKVEGVDVLSCFRQKGKLVWGEFTWPNITVFSSVDGIISGNTFELAYSRISPTGAEDHGIFRLSYSKADDAEVLEGYWKSAVNVLNRDAITLEKTTAPCQLNLRPFPGGTKRLKLRFP